jgi:hypothetical protein
MLFLPSILFELFSQKRWLACAPGQPGGSPMFFSFPAAALVWVKPVTSLSDLPLLLADRPGLASNFGVRD